MREIFKLGTVLMLYTIIAGALLAFVYIKTAPIIEAKKAAASGDTVMAEVLTGMEGGFVQQGEGSDFPYWIGYLDAGKRKSGGYILITRGKGYSSTIETMVGVDTNLTITGTKVLFQQETPGLGGKILEILRGEDDPWFTRQFIGKSPSYNITLSDDGGVIDAISGATVTSKAVTVSISNGIENLAAVLAGEEVVIEEPEETTEEDDNLMDQLMLQTEEDDEDDNLMDQLMSQTVKDDEDGDKNEEENNLMDEIMSRAGKEERNSKDDAN